MCGDRAKQKWEDEYVAGAHHQGDCGRWQEVHSNRIRQLCHKHWTWETAIWVEVGSSIHFPDLISPSCKIVWHRSWQGCAEVRVPRRWHCSSLLPHHRAERRYSSIDERASTLSRRREKGQNRPGRNKERPQRRWHNHEQRVECSKRAQRQNLPGMFFNKLWVCQRTLQESDRHPHQHSQKERLFTDHTTKTTKTTKEVKMNYMHFEIDLQQTAFPQFR